MVLGCDAAGRRPTTAARSSCTRSSATPTGPATRRSTRSAASCPSATRGPSPSRSSSRAATSLPKPAELSFEEAACLPTAWLTAYRMLFTQAGLRPGRHACWSRAPAAASRPRRSRSARAAGLVVWVTSRDEAKRRAGARARRARGVRARRAAARARRRRHRDRRQGDLVALDEEPAPRRHARRLRRDDRAPTRRPTSTGCSSCSCGCIGSTMGTRDELAGLLRLLRGDRRAAAGRRGRAAAPRRARGFERLAAGDVVGKIVLTDLT